MAERSASRPDAGRRPAADPADRPSRIPPPTDRAETEARPMDPHHRRHPRDDGPGAPTTPRTRPPRIAGPPVRRPDRHRRRDGLALGVVLKQRAMIGANDISRWCTVWALLERGTYAIDECPWQLQTQDKVFLAEPFPEPRGRGAREALLLQQAPAAADDDRRHPLSVPQGHRRAAGRPSSSQRARSGRRSRASTTSRRRTSRRSWRSTRTRATGSSTSPRRSRSKWPAYVFYFNPIVVLLNVVPLLVFLVLYARLLDRYAGNDWAWFFCAGGGGPSARTCSSSDRR